MEMPHSSFEKPTFVTKMGAELIVGDSFIINNEPDEIVSIGNAGGKERSIKTASGNVRFVEPEDGPFEVIPKKK